MDLLVFSVSGNELLAMDILETQEIRAIETLHRLPGTTPAIAGCMSIRGLTLPLVDLPRLLGNRDVPNDNAMAIVLYDAPYPCALKVSKIEHIQKTEVQPQALFKRSFIKGVLTLDSGKILQMLNLDAILDAAFAGNEAALEIAARNTREQLDEAMRSIEPGTIKAREAVA